MEQETQTTDVQSPELAAKRDFRQEVTDQIVAMLGRGTAPVSTAPGMASR